MVISMLEQIQNLLLYLLPAGDTPTCEESGDGNRLISFSLSLFLFSVGVKDMFSCLGSSTSSSFPEWVILEADVPSKENKGKMKINQGKQSLTLISYQEIILVRKTDCKLTWTLKWTFKQFIVKFLEYYWYLNSDHIHDINYYWKLIRSDSFQQISVMTMQKI